MKLLGNMEFTYTIINSDPAAIAQLQHLLEEYGDFRCVDYAQDTQGGLNSILKFSPDMAFINLEEKSETYFRMASELHLYENKVPLIIGISKTKAYAYEAIKNNFFDYWLLPYDEFDIRKSLLRLKKLMPKEEESNTLCLKSYRDFQYIDTSEILYLQADNNSTEFVMKDGTVKNAFKTLKSFTRKMPSNFVRIHQSYMVNINYISGISYGRGLCTLKLRNLQLPFSKSYRDNIDKLKNLLTKNTIPSLS